MAISLNDNIQTLANKPSDFRYGPWTGVTQANSNIPIAQRYLGLTVGILTGGVIYDYWYYSGTTDLNLILKSSAGGSSGDSGISGISGLEGISGISGLEGISGISGHEGAIGISGLSGLEGISGISGINGNPTRTFGIVIDGGGSDITTGIKGDAVFPYNATINSWTLVGQETGSIVIDVWKDTYANFPPTVADSIAGTEKPTLSSQNKNQDLTLSTWTTSISAGDIIRFNVDSCSGIKKVTLSISTTLI